MVIRGLDRWIEGGDDMGYLDNNLPPGVTDAMIEDAQRDPYEGTRYEARAHALMSADDALRAVLFQLQQHARWRGCAINHQGDCPWPERARRWPDLDERCRERLQKIEAELYGIDVMLAADEEERR